MAVLDYLDDDLLKITQSLDLLPRCNNASRFRVPIDSASVGGALEKVLLDCGQPDTSATSSLENINLDSISHLPIMIEPSRNLGEPLKLVVETTYRSDPRSLGFIPYLYVRIQDNMASIRQVAFSLKIPDRYKSTRAAVVGGSEMFPSQLALWVVERDKENEFKFQFPLTGDDASAVVPGKLYSLSVGWMPD
jgi:hypothetical protein